jgi:hypothetical protein
VIQYVQQLLQGVNISFHDFDPMGSKHQRSPLYKWKRTYQTLVHQKQTQFESTEFHRTIIHIIWRTK